MNWLWIARDFNMNADKDWEVNVVPKMSNTATCCPLSDKNHNIIGWLIFTE